MKRAFRRAAHVAGTAAAVFLLGVLPFYGLIAPLFGAKSADAVSSATVEVPEQPSGAFYILLNREKHAASLADWSSFFTGEGDLPIIFEDLDCLTAAGDEAGRQLAERYMALLPENQMRLRREDATLLVSKIEAGRFDAAVLSAEWAGALKLSPETLQRAAVFAIRGEGEAFV